MPARLDPFYTNPDLARQYAERVIAAYGAAVDCFVEPAAGQGAFVHPLRESGQPVIALDLIPQADDIRQGDFLKDDLWPAAGKIAVVGNPPFGKNSSLAVKFFNRAAERAELIAFILPRTFRKHSIHRRLNPYFARQVDEDVPDYAFVKDGKPYDVPCAWQIWEYQLQRRPAVATPEVSHIIRYVTDPRDGDFAMRRVGFYAGQVKTPPQWDLQTLSPSAHYFLQSVRPDAKDLLRGIDWRAFCQATAGSRSLSKHEIAVKLAAADSNMDRQDRQDFCIGLER